MKIWIINQYAMLPSTGNGTRHRHLAREFAARGHEVSIIAARWSHLTRDVSAADAAPQIDYFEGFRFVSVDLLRYRHAHDKRRVLNWFYFAFKLFSLRRLLGEKPDIVIYSSPALIGFVAAERIARKYGARLVFEVRDIWPLTLVQIGGFSERHPLIRLLQWIEDRAYRKADLVISNLRGAICHMAGRGLTESRFAWVANGISLAEPHDEMDMPGSVVINIPSGKFVVGYTGTLGKANAVETLINAADRLRDETDIVFVLLGAGKDREELEALAKSQNLDNVIFLGSVPKAQVQSIIARFDACWIGWRKSPLYTYGIAANKIFDYLYAARPILHSYSGKHDPIAEYGAGLTVPAEDSQALASAILRLKACPVERRQDMGDNGRAAVIKNHDYAKLAQYLESRIIDLSH